MKGQIGQILKSKKENPMRASRRSIARLLRRLLTILVIAGASAVVSRADDCSNISITTADIGTKKSQSIMDEANGFEDCLKFTVTDRHFTAGVPVTYIMSDPSDTNRTSDIMFLSNDAHGHETFCFESDRDPGHGEGCDIAGPTVDKRTEDLDLKFASADMTFYAFLVSDPATNKGSDFVGLSLTPNPEPGTMALLGSGLLGLAWLLRTRRRARGERAALSHPL